MGYFLMKMNLAIVLGVAIYGIHRLKQYVDKILSKDIDHDKEDDNWESF